MRVTSASEKVAMRAGSVGGRRTRTATGDGADAATGGRRRDAGVRKRTKTENTASSGAEKARDYKV